MDSPSAPSSVLLSLRGSPCGSSTRSIYLLSKQRLQRLPPPGTGRRRHVVGKLAPRRPEAGRLGWTGGLACRCSFSPGNGIPGPPPPPPPPSGESVDGWPVLGRWDVPWEWPTVSLTMVACAASSLVAGKVEQSVLEYLGYQAGEATIDEKAGVLFLEQFSVTAVAIAVIFGITNTFRPFSDDIFRYDFKEPFKLQNGWLLWAGVGLFLALISIALAGAAMTFLNGENTQRETDSLVLLLPLIGSSNIRFSTPVSVLITAAVFALAHLTPGEFPQLFVLGVALGFSYSQTRNLLTPITIHAVWNSGVILLLTFLQLQGYNIKELLQAS